MRVRNVAMAVAFAALYLVPAGAIYPEGHFDHVIRMNTDNFDSVIKENVDAGKTLFAPSWNDVTEQFRNNQDVAFGDVNLADPKPVRGAPYNPGAGGWPTIRYFNKKTGYAGAPYEKKTSKAVCDELGPSETYMKDFVMEKGETDLNLCKLDGKGCNEKEVQFMAKWKALAPEDVSKELARLQRMKTKSLSPDLKKWHSQRVSILKKLQASDANEEL